MEKSRCLGLIGGLGVGATVHYYERLAQGCEKLGFELDIVITNAQTSRVFEYVEAGNRDGLVDYLNGYIRRMEAAGADIAAIPAVTPLYCVKELVAISPAPVVSIFEPLLNELAARSARRVAIFGTRYVITAELFGALKEVVVIRPKPDEVDTIHNVRRLGSYRQGFTRKTREADRSRQDSHRPRGSRCDHSRRN
jgi:aspartate racemase